MKHKLLITYLVDIAAIVLICIFLMHEKIVDIGFARKELAGSDYLSSLRPIMLANAADQPLASFLPALERAEGEYGSGMQSLAANCTFANELPSVGKGAILDVEPRRDAMERGRQLISLLGDRSNLILDPEFASYYGMSIALLRYPELLDTVAAITWRLREQASSPELMRSEERFLLYTLLGRLDAARDGLEADYKKLETGSDDRHRIAIQPLMQKTMASLDQFRIAARASFNGLTTGAGFHGVEQARNVLLANIDIGWKQASTDLDLLLKARVHRLFIFMCLQLGVSLLLLVKHLRMVERRVELWANVFEASSQSILIADVRHRIVTVNKAFCDQTRYDFEQIAGRKLDLLDAEPETSVFAAQLWSQLDRLGNWQGEVCIRRHDGGHFPVWLAASAVLRSRGGISHYILSMVDLSRNKESEAQIQFLAHHDVLTGLPNRTQCNIYLHEAVQQARYRGDKVGVLYIDIDRFKGINDTFGHKIGDQLLCSVAERIRTALRAADTVSRLSGDEFLVVLNQKTGSEEVINLIKDRLLALLRLPHVIDGIEMHITCSAGFAVYPDNALNVGELMQNADAAMHTAKADGRDRVQVFTSELYARAVRRRNIESNLHYALEHKEFSLHYQPRVDPVSRALIGVEALLRWKNAELGDVPPDEFIPVAEHLMLIVPIGTWVIHEALRQQSLWQTEGFGEIVMSVNLSGLQLRDVTLVDTLRDALQRHGVSPDMMELELTESMLMDDTSHTQQQLRSLKDLGIGLSIDDFGTGYSNLSYLYRFPIDKLKIDRSFVTGMLDNPADRAITGAIIGLGHTLGLTVVAEGVETEAEACELREAWCDELQGFHVGRPMPAADLVLWIAQRAAFV